MDDSTSETLDRVKVVFLAERLRYETIRLRDLRFDKARSIVTIPTCRQIHNGPVRAVRRGILSRTSEQDWIASLLTIRFVQTCEIQNIDERGVYGYSIWDYDSGTLRARFGKRATLQMEVDYFKYDFMDIGVCGKVFTRRFPLGFHLLWAEATFPDLAGCTRSKTLFYRMYAEKEDE
ncbi:MAG: hypothetical protein IT366_12495 [Candidatus Hydrogenedentes bacterium]|nr:hypothetical protein [Candidatus Hydrogenedentota bacterium]